MKIGVFDSGIGGEAVARDLQEHFPDAQIVSVSDREHVPYGSRSAEEIVGLTTQAIQPLISTGCDVIVIACNTVTTVALPSLRQQFPSQIFVGIEPMIKLAAQLTTSGTIIVCATPATLTSTRYHELVTRHAPHVTIIEPDCSDWASLIENSKINESHIRASLEDGLNRGADVIVLGCTHYHWIKKTVELIASGRARILEPTGAIARRINQLVG